MERVLGLCFLGLSLFSCKDETFVACDCLSGWTTLYTRGLSVQAIALSGSACADGYIYSHTADQTEESGFVADAEYYDIFPADTGECSVTITLDTGETAEASTTVTRSDDEDCCPGLHPKDTQWTVPELLEE